MVSKRRKGARDDGSPGPRAQGAHKAKGGPSDHKPLLFPTPHAPSKPSPAHHPPCTDLDRENIIMTLTDVRAVGCQQRGALVNAAERWR